MSVAILEFSEWDDERQCPKDIADLDLCWRVSAIANYPKVGKAR
ncbi:hypothetical protein [Oscillatoria sp. FACHB-1406]|nr:hypothetical protein [Oscillatoria sp. FACHB-1406]